MNSPRGSAAEAWGALSEVFFTIGRPRIMRANQDLELSPPQGIVLRLLDQPRPMGELAAMMGCDNSNMTGIVDRMEERGLVRRAPAEGDRRVKLIDLTEEGRRVRGEVARRMAEPAGASPAPSVADPKAVHDV